MSLYKPESINECPECKRLREENARLKAELNHLAGGRKPYTVIGELIAERDRLKDALERVRERMRLESYGGETTVAIVDLEKALGATPTPENCFGVFTPPEPEGDA